MPILPYLLDKEALGGVAVLTMVVVVKEGLVVVLVEALEAAGGMGPSNTFPTVLRCRRLERVSVDLSSFCRTSFVAWLSPTLTPFTSILAEGRKSILTGVGLWLGEG